MASFYLPLGSQHPPTLHIKITIHYLTLILGHKRYANDGKFYYFHHQLFHSALTRMLEPLKESMTTLKVIMCPDGHYHCAIYNFGPYIGDYPK
jgi:hypothetical protein